MVCVTDSVCGAGLGHQLENREGERKGGWREGGKGRDRRNWEKESEREEGVEDWDRVGEEREMKMETERERDVPH